MDSDLLIPSHSTRSALTLGRHLYLHMMALSIQAPVEAMCQQANINLQRQTICIADLLVNLQAVDGLTKFQSQSKGATRIAIDDI